MSVQSGGDDYDEPDDNLEDLGEEITVEEAPTKDSRTLQFLKTHHPECRLDYAEDVLKILPISSFPPDQKLDVNHKSIPYLSLFEKASVIGFRANQLSQGARPLVTVPPHITDVIDIARIELEQKRMPYILKRVMPDGTFEYWRLADLLIL